MGTGIFSSGNKIVRDRLNAIFAFGVLLLSRMLHLFFSFGGTCRFEPTCSQYGALAIQKYGLVKGLLRLSKRLSYCHPLGRKGKSGFDPV